MSTRRQKIKNNQQENLEGVSESLAAPVLVENLKPVEQDVTVAVPSNAKSTRIGNSVFESLRASLKKELTFEIKGILLESQRELLKLLKPKTGENIRGGDEML